MKRGPQSKLTEAMAKRILAFVEAGETLKSALRKAGQSSSGYYRGIASFPEIRQAVKKGLEGEREEMRQQAIDTIRRAFSKSWMACAWWLERNYPGEFGKRADAPPAVSVFTPERIESAMVKVLRVKLDLAERRLAALQGKTLSTPNAATPSNQN